MPKLLPGPAAAVFSGILNLSKSLNLSIGSSISAGAAAQAVGSAFSAAFGFMSSPGMKRRRVGDSKEGLGKGVAVVNASATGESPQGATLPPKAGGGGNGVDTASVMPVGATPAVAGTSIEPPAVTHPDASNTTATPVTSLPTNSNTNPELASTNNNATPMQQIVPPMTSSVGISSVEAKQTFTAADKTRRKRLLLAMGDDES